MRFLLITNLVSPHQLPLAKALAELFTPVNFRYVADEVLDEERRKMGWCDGEVPDWVLFPRLNREHAQTFDEWKHAADVVLCGCRDWVLFEDRCRANKLTLYMSERWFKPPLGAWRLLHPAYFRMAVRLVSLCRCTSFRYLPIGVHAANDMRRIAKMLGFFVPKANAQGGAAVLSQAAPLLWGYCVAPSATDPDRLSADPCVSREASVPAEPSAGENGVECRLNVLWVGRMLRWKHADTVIRAAALLLKEGHSVRLTLVGQGPEERRLRQLAASVAGRYPPARVSGGEDREAVAVLRSVPIADVRSMMRKSDVYVLASDGAEGWGAVVNEALEEGCPVVATHESGAGATLIRHGENGLLFKAGDVHGLAANLRLLLDPACRGRLAGNGLAAVREVWGPEPVAGRLFSLCTAYAANEVSPVFSSGPLSKCRC